jgi:hypothetical protein
MPALKLKRHTGQVLEVGAALIVFDKIIQDKCWITVIAERDVPVWRNEVPMDKRHPCPPSKT